MYAVFENANEKFVDTILCKDNGQFKCAQDNPVYTTVTLFLDKKTKWVTIYLEPKKKVSVSGDALYPSAIQVKGGKINDGLSAFKENEALLLKEKDNLKAKFKDPQTAANMDKADASSRLMNLKHQLSEDAVKYIQQHPADLVSAVLIQSYFMDPDDTRRLDELLAVLSPELRSSYIVQELQQFSAKAKRTEIGAEAPAFAVKDIFDKEVNLPVSDKKYLLLSFAAPWCDICKTENLYLKEIRRNYPKEKLAMLTVTLDEDQAEVRKTALSDSISWHLVSDSAGYASMIIDLYGINAIPKNFLIDENGNIIFKTENGMELQQMLDSLIN